MRKVTVSEYIKLGAKIRYYRQLMGINQSELAEIVCISPQYLSKIECGRRIPSIPIMAAIAKALNMSIAELLKETGL